MAVVRLAHPFPSLLNAAATVGIATIAGGPPEVALRLGASMLALQASIGALNDAVDAPIDSARKPGKPIPRGLATSGGATALAATALVVGLGLSAPSGIPTVLVALGGVACGYAYDLGLARTAWSWLPLVVALPLLPIHAWLGATGHLPPGLVILLPAAVVAGGLLALANAVVDVERDAAAGRPTIAVRLGRRRAWLAQALLTTALSIVVVIAAPRVTAAPAVIGLPLGDAALGAGLAFLGIGAIVAAHPRPAIRERGWELEAIGVAIVGLGWLLGAAALDA